MTQLIKHYYINRETGGWATNTSYGLVMPNIKGLEIKHHLSNENGVLFFLSEVPDYFEYEVTVSQEQLVEYENNSNITIISSSEKQIEVFTSRQLDLNPSKETRLVTVYDVIYRETYIISETEGEGIKILTQVEWDTEIECHDNRQIQKRYDILREIRDKILELTDWMVIKDLEQNGSISVEFKTWRQSLRDLPNSQTFPTGFPTLPTELQGHSEINALYDRFNEVKSIPMIHDPLT